MSNLNCKILAEKTSRQPNRYAKVKDLRNSQSEGWTRSHVRE